MAQSRSRKNVERLRVVDDNTASSHTHTNLEELVKTDVAFTPAIHDRFEDAAEKFLDGFYIKHTDYPAVDGTKGGSIYALPSAGILQLSGQIPLASPAPVAPGSKTFLSSGTFVVPIGYDTVTVCLSGGGGSGAGSYQLGGYGVFGGGGAGSGSITTTISGLTQGQVIPVTVGTGGARVKGNSDGFKGGTSSFGAFITAEGGNGGVKGSPSKTKSIGVNGGGNGGYGGVYPSFVGSDGSSSVNSCSSNYAGGTRGTFWAAFPGGGGAGGFGNGGNQASDAPTNSGAGGGGAADSTSNSGRGGDGQVTVTWG